MHDQYFQGILQLRNPITRGSDTKSHLKEVEEFIERNHTEISKKVKVRNGFDYYMKSNKFQRSLAKKLIKRFGGIVKESPKLFTRNNQTSKEVYRLNVLFRLLNFKKGDIIEINNKIIKVNNIGKKVGGIDIKNNKKGLFKLEDKEYNIIDTLKTRVIKTNPQIEILDEDYQPVKIENEKKVYLNEKVEVVKHKGYYLI